MSIIQGGGAHNVDSAGAVFDHTIGQSLRFNDNDNAYLKRDITSSSNQRTWTWSAWVKRANLGSQQVLFTDGKSSSYSTFRFNSDDTLYVQLSAKQKTSSQVFRDVSAWYHFVWRVDTTQATDDDRSRIYVNGTQITSFSSEQHVNQNTDSTINQSGNDHLIGGYSSGTSRNFDGYMAEVNFVDGISYGPENFGETKDGVWIPKQYTGSYGTNGFHLDFSTSSFTDNSSDPDVFADQAGSNDFNAYNLAASDIVPDSPTNNFATLNVLDKTIGGPPISEGNLKISGGGSGYDGTYATIAVTSGKWYAEFLYISGDNRGFFGIAREERLSYVNSGSYLGNILDTYGLDFRARSYTGTSATSSSGSQLFDQTNFDTGDIGLLCFDVDAGKLWFGRRDVSGSTTIWYDSSGNNNGDPSAGSNPTYTFTATGSTWYIGCHDYAGTGLMANFGQDGSFAGEITSQGASDANGIGDFNYIETGFLALCTSNLPDITIGPGQNTIALDNFETMIYAGNDTEQHIGSGGARHPQDTVTIANSLRLNDDDSGKLYFDPSSDGNKQIFTFSAWVKRATLGVNYQVIFGGKNVGGNQTDIRFDGSDQLRIVTAAASLTMDFKTNRTFKSLATWYHIVVAVDTTDSTLLNRVKIYVDGVQETDLQTTTCTVNTNCILNTATNQTTNVGALGYTTTVSNEFDGYLAEVNFIDGTQLDPTYFGQVGSNGYWVPKTITGVTYGENGFRLNFADSSDLGNDVSGRNNDFTVITSTFSATDQVIDSPTQNFATLVPMSNIALSEGNLKMTTSRTGNWDGTIGSFGVNSGKWYYEVRMSATEGTFRCVAGWQGNQASQTVTYNGKGASGSPYNTLFDNYQVSSHTTYFYKDGDTNGTTTAPSSGDVINVAVDFDAGKIWFGVNGTYYANDGGTDGNPGAGTNESLSGIDPTVQEYVPAFHIRSDSSTGGNVMIVNFGQEGTFVNTETAGGNSDANGVGNFFNAVPSGFLALVDDNIPQTGIKSPDWVWIKQRNGNSHSHYLFDSVRGPGKDLHSDVGNQEATSLTTLKSFDNQGFTVGTEDDVNDGLDTYVAWTWKAGGAPTVDNSAAANATPTAGSVKIDGANKTDAFSGSPDLAVTRLSANTTAGFSIVAYTGSSSNPKTVPHGLTQALDAIIVKRREGGDSWAVGHVSHGFNNSSNLRLEESSQASSGANGFSSDPDANVFTVGSEPVVNSASSYIAYCFHSVPGYSKFGSYVGNANADGAFVFTGFRPAWVMIKNVGTSGSWIIFDSTREGGVFNVINDHLMADTYADEGTDDDIDFLSNGFKCRRSSTSFNSDHTFIYFAFAEAPFKFANAR